MTEVRPQRLNDHLVRKGNYLPTHLTGELRNGLLPQGKLLPTPQRLGIDVHISPDVCEPGAPESECRGAPDALKI
jgi:hypothetical protein